MTIMISYQGVHVSYKASHDKAGVARLQVVHQAAL
jgi:hypothetical protein